ncbi:hypothetical protein QQF64_007225 [Cirrhinus molitorella]|uniref:Uncharacterized protein n=1 Tax=Cirrhinus molitorella TaxID=172907 RepID=A0ABR3MAQ6_9TELE
MASPKDPHLQARPLSSPQESNRIDLKPAQSLPACSHTAHLHEVQGCLGCTVGWRRSASVLEELCIGLALQSDSTKNLHLHKAGTKLRFRSDFSIRVKCLLCSSLYSSYNSEILEGKDPGV